MSDKLDSIKQPNPTKNDPFDLIKRIIFAYWPVYAISIILSLIIAKNIIKYTAPNYEIYAKVLIKDEDGNSAGKDILKEMDLF